MRKLYLPKLLRHKPKDTPEDTLEVLIYEIGDVAKCIHHARTFPESKDAYIAELSKALSDAITQIRILCEWYDFSFAELLQNGYEDFIQMLKERFPRDST